MPRESAGWCPTPSGSGNSPDRYPAPPPLSIVEGSCGTGRSGTAVEQRCERRAARSRVALVDSRMERPRASREGTPGEAGSLGAASRAGVLVPKGGLEPPRIAPYAPQAYVSTNSTTSATWVGTLDPGGSKGSVIINMRRRDRKTGTTGRLVPFQLDSPR